MGNVIKWKKSVSLSKRFSWKIKIIVLWLQKIMTGLTVYMSGIFIQKSFSLTSCLRHSFSLLLSCLKWIISSEWQKQTCWKWGKRKIDRNRPEGISHDFLFHYENGYWTVFDCCLFLKLYGHDNKWLCVTLTQQTLLQRVSLCLCWTRPERVNSITNIGFCVEQTYTNKHKWNECFRVFVIYLILIGA